MLPPKFIFDGRNILDPEKMGRMGFTYRGVGRGEIRSATPKITASHHAEVRAGCAVLLGPELGKGVFHRTVQVFPFGSPELVDPRRGPAYSTISPALVATVEASAWQTELVHRDDTLISLCLSLCGA